MSKKVTTTTFRRMKREKQKISMLTAYDYPTAKILDQSGVDAILVGDSLGMVMLGYKDTTQVTMEDMIHHIKAVSRGVERAFIVGDMPFLSYHMGIEKTVYNAGRIIQEGGAQAVKLEGGQEIISDVKAIIKAGIPVMGHIGLTPQSVHQLGGYAMQGKTNEQVEQLLQDALSLEEAGVFAIVLEYIPADVASMITARLTIPTIGIGAGNGCDGQVLVTHDMLGMFPGRVPKFVKSYGHLGSLMQDSVEEYIAEVKSGVFPDEEHSFSINREPIKNLYGGA